jgi:N-acetyltransferase
MLESRILEGEHVRLEPLSLAHLDALCAVGFGPDLWRWIPSPVETRKQMQAYIKLALQWQAAGTALPFVTVERLGNRVVGSTRFANYDAEHRRVEMVGRGSRSHGSAPR